MVCTDLILGLGAGLQIILWNKCFISFHPLKLPLLNRWWEGLLRLPAEWCTWNDNFHICWVNFFGTWSMLNMSIHLSKRQKLGGKKCNMSSKKITSFQGWTHVRCREDILALLGFFSFIVQCCHWPLAGAKGCKVTFLFWKYCRMR